MLTADVKHRSTISRDHKILRRITSFIQDSGKGGIKRGELILKSEVPFAQWQFYHNILIDIDDVEWIKQARTYKHMRPTEPKSDV